MKYLILLSVLIAGSVQAEPEFERIKKDVSVMANIIKGAFESEPSCKRCDPKIETSYLVNQGAVFNIRENSWTSFHFGHEEDGFSFVIPPAEPAGVRRVEIKQMVGDILEDVGVVMDEVGDHIEMSIADLEGDHAFRIDTDTRRGLRELNRERRELEYQRREYEIELIHEDDEEERQRVEKRVQGIEENIAELEKKQAKLNKSYEAEKQEREAARQKKRQQLKEQQLAMSAQVENVVLRSLCDYGTTLRNIPNDEHVSVIFESKNGDQNRVFVMESSDVNNCKSPDTLRKDAETYLF